MTAVRKAKSARVAMIAKVKIGQKQLGWKDDVYRHVLSERYGVDSATKLQEHQLDDLIGHMKSCGFRPIKRAKKSSQKPMADSDLARKIRALWISLYHLAEVEDSSEEALLKFAQRITRTASPDGAGLQALQWITNEQAWLVIEALKSWAIRIGVTWNHPYGPRAAIVKQQWAKLKTAQGGPTRIGAFNVLIAEVTGKMSLAYCSPEDLDSLISNLGTRLRELK